MMDPRELRISNYVNDVDKPVQIKSIGQGACLVIDLEDDFIDELSDYICDSKRLEPIKLTEQHLIDFGFEKTDAIDLHNIYYYYDIKINTLLWLSINTQDWHLIIGNRSDWTGEIVKVNTVHKLQNLVYLLSGKELTK